jgi:putative tryptophan/tyrosine transport system substrate-binding protein
MTKWIHRAPWRILSGLVLALAIFASLTAEAQASGTTTFTDWFKVGSSVLEDWDITVSPTDPLKVRIRPKRTSNSQPLRRIMVLYPRPSSAYDTAITKVLSVMADKRVNVEFTVQNFKIDDVLGRQAIEAAEAGNYDLILSMGSESTAWLWANYRGGRLAVVTVCSKDPVLLGQVEDYNKGSGTNFAFTSLNMPIDAQMSYVMQVRPELKNLAILVDAHNVSAVQTQAIPAKEYARARGVRVLDLVVKNPKQVKEELAVLVRDAVTTMRKNDPDLANSLFWITGSTAVFAEITTINAHSFRVPVLSAVTDVVLPGDDSAVLSVGISFESNAHLSAIYITEVLERRRPAGQMPVGVASPPDVAINFRKAREIGMRIPFALFESATRIFDNDGNQVRPEVVRGSTQ